MKIILTGEKIMKLLKSLGRKNSLMKPLSVIMSAGPAAGYLLTQSNKLVAEQIDPETVAVSLSLVKGIEGGILLLFVIIGILQVYKPPKSVLIPLVLGGVMMFASSLFMTLGVALLFYASGVGLNKLTINKLVIRNDRLRLKNEELEVEKLLK